MSQENPASWNVSQLVGPLPAFYANQVSNAFTAQAGSLYLVTLSTSSTAQLPDATQNPGAIVAIVLKTPASHTLTVESAVAGQTIGGSSSVAMTSAQEAILVASDGSNYDILSSDIAVGNLEQTFLTSSDESASLPNSVEAGAAAFENLSNADLGAVVDDGAGNLHVVLGAAAGENLGADIIDNGSGSLKLANTAVTPGTYTTLSSITISADGRITAYTE